MLAINQETVRGLAANPTVVVANRQIEFLALEISLATDASAGGTKSAIAVPSNARLVLVKHASASMAQLILPTPTPTPDVSILVPSYDDLAISSVRSCSIPCRPRSCPGMERPKRILLLRQPRKTKFSITIPIPMPIR